jgi:hypothetical protein
MVFSFEKLKMGTCSLRLIFVAAQHGMNYEG